MTSETPPLLPCPFCGGGLSVKAHGQGFEHPDQWVQCSDCEITIAIEVWNRRASKPTPAEPMERFTKAAMELADGPHSDSEFDAIYRRLLEAFRALTPEPGEPK